MKFKFLFVIILSFLAIIPGDTFPQTIHRHQLDEFQGSVLANLNRHGGKVLGKDFEQWSCDTNFENPSWNRINYRKNADYLVFLGYRKIQAPAYNIPASNMVVIPLQDIFGHERQNHLLSFWEANGDSLQFKFFDSTIHTGGINHLTVREVMAAGGDDLLVVTEGYSSDHGVFGKYEFSVFNWKAQSVKHLHSEKYSHIAGKAEGDTLGFELICNGQDVEVRLIRRHLSFDSEKSETQHKRSRTVTKTDTTVIPLIKKTEMNNAVILPEFGTSQFHIGGTIHYGGFSLTVPDSFRVLHVDAVSHRLLITAFWALDESKRGMKYQSELWVFNTSSPNRMLDFSDRQVLLSLESDDGMAKQLCYKTVNCLEATALYINGYGGGGQTLLFDAKGNPISVEWPRYKTGDTKQAINTVRPLTWYQDEFGEEHLACLAYDEGDDDPFMFLYCLRSGEIEMGPVNDVLGRIGREIFIPFSNDGW